MTELSAFPVVSETIKNMRTELKKLNALARKYRLALEEIELNPQADAVAIAKDALKD